MKLLKVVIAILVFIVASVIYWSTQVIVSLADVPVEQRGFEQRWLIISAVFYFLLMLYLFAGKNRFSRFRYMLFCLMVLLCSLYLLVNPFDVCTTQFRILSDSELFSNLHKRYYAKRSEVDSKQLQFKNINKIQNLFSYFTQKRMFDRGITVTVTDPNSTEARKRHWYLLNYCGAPIDYIGAE